jgi:hypothetical protein
MGSIRRIWVASLLAAAMALLSSCSGSTVHQADSPGHHPQSHAYGNKHLYGYELVYDTTCGVYVVVGLTDCYYADGFFYRLRGNAWEISVQAEDWRIVAYETLPRGLKVKAKPVVKPDTKVLVQPSTSSPAKVNTSPAKLDTGKPGKINGNATAKPTGLTKARR